MLFLFALIKLLHCYYNACIIEAASIGGMRLECRLKAAGRSMQIWISNSKNFDSTLCPKKSIPDIFDCNMKTNYQILIIFATKFPTQLAIKWPFSFSTHPIYASPLPRKNKSSEIYVKNKKPDKNIPDIIGRTLNKN